jgi:hypothetical protein
MDLKIGALRIYLEEMQQLHQQLRAQNDQIATMLIGQGHQNIRERLRFFQLKYISDKMAQLLP